ncbi:MAG: hypothetical protein K2G03_00875, partial [Bacilli bacterium]|nr:hypothetical protein [Bacilli bacterium]
MEREVIEHNKVRCIRLDTGYTYQESVKDEQTGEFVEMIDIVKESDYSIFYMNFTGEEKIGTFHIESDSLFIEPFRNLVLEDQEFRILDDYSDRYVSIFKEENGGVTIEVHLLPGEFDASIEL